MITDYIPLQTANVYGIYGHLGGGKSLTAVEIAVFFLSKGFPVASNIKLRGVESLKGAYTFYENFEGVDFWSLPCGAPRGSNSDFRSCIVIDECAEFFDQYSSTSPVLKNFLSWLRHSSKRGQFVFLVVQQPEFIAKSLRLLINKWIICTDLQQFRLPVFKVGFPFLYGYVWRRVIDKYGNLLSRGLNLGDKVRIGQYYDTAQIVSMRSHSNDYEDRDDIRTPQLGFLRLVLVVLFVLYLLSVVLT